MLGKLTLDHVARFERVLVDANITDSIIALILLPNYSTDEVSERRLAEARQESE